ncbi:pseudouridine synthase [Capnocytophaga sputigena]|jgi:pseudouridylate synthase|uniref:pseudouridine synthase n=1 Tax=Capnocytophaga sputigena TaxID=1019 RepID=UPI000BB1B352|nr:pseudouridine synthase [Capnocytophaga sputigena]ATA69978.1 ribosomal large subunit pseudouridine synthase B [Capnocytophaga sputigena]PBN46662.1 ribosomal large subunit pseudouridine synthase B [Capnocytophaga sputigena]
MENKKFNNNYKKNSYSSNGNSEKKPYNSSYNSGNNRNNSNSSFKKKTYGQNEGRSYNNSGNRYDNSNRYDNNSGNRYENNGGNRYENNGGNRYNNSNNGYNSENRKSYNPNFKKNEGYSKPNNYNRNEGYNRNESYNRNEGYKQNDNYKKPFNKKPYNNTYKPQNNAPIDYPTVTPAEVRLNKYIADAGICSRRNADMYISSGNVTVNGEVMTTLGYRVKPTDEVRFDGKLLSSEKKEYILLNKPKGFITTTNDEKGRKTVMDLVANATNARILPVGRLDRATTGLLLLTNDGELTKKLTHPTHGVRKIYHVILDRKLDYKDFMKVQDGLELEDGLIEVDEISYVNDKPKNEIGIKIHSGRNRIVRRIFEHLGYQVEKLDRVVFAGLTKKDLPRGHWRRLTQQEVINLRNMK